MIDVDDILRVHRRELPAFELSSVLGVEKVVKKPDVAIAPFLCLIAYPFCNISDVVPTYEDEFISHRMHPNNGITTGNLAGEQSLAHINEPMAKD